MPIAINCNLLPLHGENQKSIITIDCKKLRSEINDDSNDDEAVAVIFSRNISINHEKEISDKRYFNVILEDITEKRLLQKDKVFNYLSRVAPVPFNASFSFKKEIKTYLKKRALMFLNTIYMLTMTRFSNYTVICYMKQGRNNKTVIDSIHSIEFRDVVLNDNTIAILWFGISKFIKHYHYLPIRLQVLDTVNGI